MRFYFDTRLDLLVTAKGTESALTEIELKHSPHQRIEIQFGKSGDDTADIFSGGSNWTAEYRGVNSTFTTAFGTDANVLTLPDASDFSNDDQAYVVTSDTLPAGLSVDIFYYVVNKSGDDIELSLTQGGAPITLTSDGTGTHTIYRKPEIIVGCKDDGEFVDGTALASQSTFTIDTANSLYILNLDLTTSAIRTALAIDADGGANDVAKIESAEFEILFRDDPDSIEWRPQVNPVAATIHNSVFDGSLSTPT